MYDDFDDWHDLHDDHHFGGAATAGAAYALFRHGQDEQTQDLLGGLAGLLNARPEPDSSPTDITVNVRLNPDDDDPTIEPVNAADFSDAGLLDESWDDYIGQEALKRTLRIAMNSAELRGASLDHILLASPWPGVGKTKAARLIAKTFRGGVNYYELVPPFNIYTLVKAAETLADGDILFIDEIHRLAQNGKKGSEILLKFLDEKVAYLPDGSVHQINDITVIGATTDRDLLPETVVDRFKTKPYFQRYTIGELTRIAVQFAFRHDAESYVDDELAVSIALACRETPRITEELVIAARDLALHYSRPATTTEVLEYMELEPDGMGPQHIHYITAMRRFFAQKTKDDKIEYIIGEPAITQLLRETKQGIGRIERFLIERGLLDRTPRGRRLTAAGVARAEAFIRAGKGATSAQ